MKNEAEKKKSEMAKKLKVKDESPMTAHLDKTTKRGLGSFRGVSHTTSDMKLKPCVCGSTRVHTHE